MKISFRMCSLAPKRIGADGWAAATSHVYASDGESAVWAALACISEDASSLKDGRIWRDVALVLTGADVQVCAPVKENRTQETSTTT